MNSKNFMIVFTLLTVLSIFIVNQISSTSSTQNNTNGLNEITSDDFSIKISDINSLITNNLTGFIYFGRDTCSNCLNFNTFLKDILIENKQISVYKFDTDKWRSHQQFQSILDNYNVSQIPTLVHVQEDGSYTTFELKDKREIKQELTDFLLQES